MEISPASTADIPALSALLSILFTQEADFTPNDEAQRRGLARIINNPDIGLIVVARQNGKVVGMVNLLYTVSTALGERVAILEDMIVSPDARGAGIGSSLLEQAIHLARVSGCKRITLLTDSSNKSAQRFYQQHGFGFSAMVPLRLLL